VSKAITPPFHDGATCFVRDLSRALDRVHPTVLSTNNAPSIAPTVASAPVYQKRSRYSPALVDNLRVFQHLLRDTDHDIWHFVFAPNPVSSFAGNVLHRLRNRPIVQTVASRPLRFDSTSRLLFGDRIIALSKFTADRLLRNNTHAHVTVIPPSMADLSRTTDEQRTAREQAGIDQDAALILYAGDLEFSSGASMMAAAAPTVLDKAPNTIIAFACRAKTPRSIEQQRTIAERLKPFGSRVRFLGEVKDLPALIASACAMPFPVDDLYGKIDHPYVILESALLQVPVLVPNDGPIAEIHGIPTMPQGDVKCLAGWCVEMAQDANARQQVGAALRKAVLTQHNPSTIAAAVTAVYDDLLHSRMAS